MSIESNLKRLIIPFIYVYSLSLALIFMSAFLLANSNNKSISYAQSENYLSDNIISINLSSGNIEETIASEPQVIDICENEIVKKIDSYLDSRNYKNLKTGTLYKSPLANHGCDFYKNAIENDLDPMLVFAISIKESGAGVNSRKVNGSETYNAWGWGIADDPKTTERLGTTNWCESWTECIEIVSKGIKNGSDKRNLTTTPEDIATWYNPGSETWGPSVQNIMDKLYKYEIEE